MPGDLALVEADGRVTLLGRGSSSINSGGEKVFPDEVEATLKSHPQVFDATVLGTPDERWGEQVTAIVQLRAGGSVDPQVLVDHCRQHLADFKAPRRIIFVEQLKRRSSGKPDYQWAKALIADRGLRDLSDCWRARAISGTGDSAERDAQRRYGVSLTFRWRQASASSTGSTMATSHISTSPEPITACP